jgi:hypothetical protein
MRQFLMSRIIKIAAVAAIIIFVAAYLFIYNSEGTTKALVVQAPISDADEITKDMIAVKDIPVSMVPKDIVTSPDEVVGKMVTTSRLPGDFIPRSIVAVPEEVTLGPDEVLLTMNIPQLDSILAQMDKKILLALYGSQDKPPVIVDGIEIYQMKGITSGSTGQQQPYAVIKTTSDKAKLIMPYLISGSYKILSNNGQPLSGQPQTTPTENQSFAQTTPAENQSSAAGLAEQNGQPAAADNGKAMLTEYYNRLVSQYKSLADAYNKQQKAKDANAWKTWSEQWTKELTSMRTYYESAVYDSSVNTSLQQLKSASDALNRLWTAYNASLTGTSQAVDINAPKADYDKYITAAAASLGIK